MTPNEAWKEVACECPRKIMVLLHEAGVYVHGTTARFPGKILCIHKDSELPADFEPTPAQEIAWELAAEDHGQTRHAE